MKKEKTSPITGYLRLKQIVGDKKAGIQPLIPVCPATLWNYVKQGKFPKPIKLSSAVTVWRTEDVYAFIENGGKQ